MGGVGCRVEGTKDLVDAGCSKASDQLALPAPCSPARAMGSVAWEALEMGHVLAPDSSLLPTQADRTCVPTPRATPGDVESLGLFP